MPEKVGSDALAGASGQREVGPAGNDGRTSDPTAATKLGTVSALTCSKCSGEDILVRWHSTGGRYGDGGCGYYAKVVETGEHMHFTCRTCQYEWTGVPADAAV